MPNYRRHGKILKILLETDFQKGMQSGLFHRKEHRAYPVLLYYSGVRKMEALRATPEQFTFTDERVNFDVGARLKKIRRKRKGKEISEETYQENLKKRLTQITTPPLPLPRQSAFMNELVERIEATDPMQPIFPFSPKTAYNIIDRVFYYPHHFRLTRITWFFMPHPEVGRPRGFSIAEVRNFTGLSLGALNYYIGLSDLEDMGRAMYQEQLKGGKTNEL